MNDESAPGLGFSVEIEEVGDVGADTDRVDALITIEARSTGNEARAAQVAEVLIMDQSGSMNTDDKIGYAQRATCAAIDELPDGMLFGIIAGNGLAEKVYPIFGGLGKIDDRTRSEAKRLVNRLTPYGGTKISAWLMAANELFATGPKSGIIRHAVLYSDGKNQHDTPEELGQALRACADQFICDVRGIGEDWDYRQLLPIAQSMYGEGKGIVDCADLAEDFAACMRRAIRLAVARTYLRLSPDLRFRLDSVTQTHPELVDLNAAGWERDETSIRIPLGSWEPGIRRYQLTLRFEPGQLPVEERVRATPLELIAENLAGELERRAHAALVVCRQAVARDPTGRQGQLTALAQLREITASIEGCIAAWEDNRWEDADRDLDRAVRLATDLHDDFQLALLNSIADRRQDGRVRLRRDVKRGEMQRLGMDSTKTGSLAGPPESPEPTSRKCPQCRTTAYGPKAKFCENCRFRFSDEDGA